jgi:hypothetical protein
LGRRGDVFDSITCSRRDRPTSANGASRVDDESLIYHKWPLFGRRLSCSHGSGQNGKRSSLALPGFRIADSIVPAFFRLVQQRRRPTRI